MKKLFLTLAACLIASPPSAYADESLFGALKGTETLPAGALEIIQHLSQRSNKGQGTYSAKQEIRLKIGFNF